MAISSKTLRKNKKNSIFVRILIIVALVSIVQTAFFYVLHIFSGTYTMLNTTQLANLEKNVETRGLTLENAMVKNWSNIGLVQDSFSAILSNYCETNVVTAEEVLSNNKHQSNILAALSGDMLKTLRSSNATGIFICLFDESSFNKNEFSCGGALFRDLDLISTPVDFSDIMLVRGNAKISNEQSISLDRTWSESFTFNKEETNLWNVIGEPYGAALEFPNLSALNLSRWNQPVYFDSKSGLDTNECITYSRPLYHNNKLVGVIGTEIQINTLITWFPEADLGEKSGFMLLKHSADSGDKIITEVVATTGSYISSRIANTNDLLSLTKNSSNNFYSLTDAKAEAVEIVLRPLRLYNSNAPFSNETWTLSAIASESVLFEASTRLEYSIRFGALMSLLLGISALWIGVRVTTKPLILLADQIVNNKPYEAVEIRSGNTYEINLLSSTINEMKNKQMVADLELREERERYLIALESATDTFIELDMNRNVFKFFSFQSDGERSNLVSQSIENFSELVASGGFCHEDDCDLLKTFSDSNGEEDVELRILANVITIDDDKETDEGFSWFYLKGSGVNSADGSVKIIGIARGITDEKLREKAVLEATRRDASTGLYKADCGNEIIKSMCRVGKTCMICALRLGGFDSLEMHYGRYFCAVILIQIGKALKSTFDFGENVLIRASNDELEICIPDSDRLTVNLAFARLVEITDALYIGEHEEIKLKLYMGISEEKCGQDVTMQTQRAFHAAEIASRRGGESPVYFNTLTREEKNYSYERTPKPTDVSIELTKEGIAGFVFDVFERTADTDSVIKILMQILGDMFSLDRIIISRFDRDFGTRKALYSWNSPNLSECSNSIEKVSQVSVNRYMAMLDANSTLVFNSNEAQFFDDDLKKHLFVSDETFSCYCCEMFENGIPVGHILYFSEGLITFSDQERASFYEISKIVSANMMIAQSNSASRSKSEFLSKMSHEIRTPMNAIIGMLGISKKVMDDKVRLNDSLNKIDISAKHLLSLINDVLDMARIESGKTLIVNEPFALESFINSIDMLMRSQIEAKSNHFETISNFESIKIDGDEPRIRQVLINLIGNANKFTNPGGKIVFSITETPVNDETSLFRFSVKDTGVGISKESQKTVFNAFEQVRQKATTSNSIQGTGLGLTISANLITAMGGRLELESDEGIGSEFFFSLKHRKYSESDLAKVDVPDKSDKKLFSFAGKRVLVVDDVEINREIALFLLEEEGFIVETAVNGQIAVDKFFGAEPGFYDVILMDIQMPVMDGLTATREIRKNTARPDARTIPIVAMTANAFDEDTKKSVESGMNGHLIKPVESEKLFELLNTFLKD